MVMGKTAALFRAACVMGAALSGANAAQIKWADAYGQHYGIMFQLLDDFADFVHDSEEGRASYARLLGSEAEHILQQEAAEARVNAQHLDSSGLLVHRIDDMMNLDER